MTYVTKLKREAAEHRVRLSGATAKVKALQAELDEIDTSLQAMPKKSTRLARLQRQRATAEEVYTTLTDQLQEVRLADEATIAPAEVVRPALVPESPVLPRTLIVVAGILLGLSLGVIVAVIRYKIDSRLYTPEDLQQHNFRPAGVVPEWQRRGERRRLLPSAHSADAERDPRSESTVLASREDATAASEAYRRLYVNVQSATSREAQGTTVLVTSPEPGVGKSTTALNLAAAAARSGRRTLLVDADLCKPQIRTGAVEALSLTEFLDDPVRGTEHFTTSVENLYVIPLREWLEDPEEVLRAPEMERFIDCLCTRFDLIIFDTPPVLAMADATFLAPECDATLVVAQAGKTEVEELGQATTELRDAHAEVVGTVLNRFNPSEPSSYTSRYEYQDYYSNGRHDVDT